MRRLLMLAAVFTVGILLMGSAAYAQHDDPDMEWEDLDEIVEEKEDASAVPLTAYDRWGGKTAIKAIVSEFTARVLSDERIKDRVAGIDRMQWKTALVGQITEAAGGGEYTGKSLKEGALGMGLSGNDINVLAEQMERTLDWFEFNYGDKRELLTKLELIVPAETPAKVESSEGSM